MPLEFKDYYQILGVAPKATGEDIKKAFRTLARKHHPDVAKDKKTAEEKFKELNEAHEVLSDPESRREYDQLGANWKTGAEPGPAPGWARGRPAARAAGDETYEFQFEGTGFSDFFEQFFGRRARRARGGSPFAAGESASGPVEAEEGLRGQDIQGDILITLTEVLQGAMRTISVRRTNARTGHEENHTCQVRIPPGVQEGQSIRVPGKGGMAAAPETSTCWSATPSILIGARAAPIWWANSSCPRGKRCWGQQLRCGHWKAPFP